MNPASSPAASSSSSAPMAMSSLPSLTQTQVLAFNAITNFIKALASEFAGVQKSLALYARLVEHMTLSHYGPVTKVIDSFVRYLTANQVAVETSAVNVLKDEPILYSEQVFINLKAIFAIADSSTKEVIWKHLLTIYGILFPDSQARDLLKKINAEKKGGNQELLSSMIGKIMPVMGSADVVGGNPMQAVMGLMSSGVFTELLGMMQSGVESGNVNMNTLLGEIGTMFAQPDPTAKLTIAQVPPEDSDTKK